MIKIDYSPFLQKIAVEHDLSPGAVHKALKKVAPGGVSRRAVGYWFADPGEAAFRRCDSHWVSLLLMSLQREGKLKKADVEHYLKSMEAISEFVSFKENSKHKSNKAFASAISAEQMALLQQVLDRSERGRSAYGRELIKGNPFPVNPGKARSSVPGF